MSKLAIEYQNHFQGISAPNTLELKEKGLKSSTLDQPYELVWKSLILVAMQYAPIVKASKKAAYIVFPPFILFLDRRTQNQHNSHIIYASLTTELYAYDTDTPQDAIQLTENQKFKYLKELLWKIEAQILVKTKLSTGGRWNYLVGE